MHWSDQDVTITYPQTFKPIPSTAPTFAWHYKPTQPVMFPTQWHVHCTCRCHGLPIRIYMGILILGSIFQYTVSASLGCTCRTHTRIHAHVRTHTHAQTHACTHMYTHVRTHTHTDTHTHTHTLWSTYWTELKPIPSQAQSFAWHYKRTQPVTCNSFPPNDTTYMYRCHGLPIRIYMGILILGSILQYTVSASSVWVVKS